MARRSSNFKWRCWRTTTCSIRSLLQSTKACQRTRPGRPALEAQIGDYSAAADEYLQARSSDLADLRDRVLQILRGGESEAPRIPSGAVVCAEDLPPSRFLEIDWSGGGGLALLRGSPNSHVAMWHRARGIPMVVQLGSVPANARTALLDGEGAPLELDPSAEQLGLFERGREFTAPEPGFVACHSERAPQRLGRRADKAPDQYPARRGS